MAIQNTLNLGDVPFYWRVKTAHSQPPLDIPASLPFSFSIVEDLQLIIQQRNPDVLRWLERVYGEDANVGYLQEGHALAESYGGEFIDFFERAAAMMPKRPETAADIGCGGVYLLQEIRKHGLNVTGIDPSPVTAEAGRKAGIEIISDFYPSPALTTQFDVLFHYDVLEHVENPVEFLRAHHANLSSTGGLIFAVPDCSHHIRLGDISMLLHEHLNYFDEESLANVVRAAGFEPQLLQSAKHGGVLLCFATRSQSQMTPVRPQKETNKFDDFKMRAQIALGRFADIATLEDNHDALGLYVPLRAFPYLSRIEASQHLRFFDDDPGLHKRYYDGFDIPIENFSDAIAKPPKQLMICSLAFGDRIAARLRNESLHGTRIFLWADLFSEEKI